MTGAAGFIGSHFADFVVKNHLKESDSLILIDKLTYAGKLSNLENVLQLSNVQFYKNDICDSDGISRITESADVLVNFAAESHVDRSIANSAEFMQSNVIGVHSLLEITRRNRIKKFIQISTDEVYGSLEDGFAEEDSPLKPNSPYSASKASADLICRSYFETYGIDVRITRCGNNYGTRQFPEKLIPVLIDGCLKGKSLPIYGNGMNIRNWIHVSDHVRGIWEVLQNGKPGHIYNIGGLEYYSNIQIAHLICQKLDYPSSKIQFVQDRLGHDFRYGINADKIQEELGFIPRELLGQQLSDMVNWYSSANI